MKAKAKKTISYLVIGALLTLSSYSHAGWVVGEDSSTAGVLRVSKNKTTGIIAIHHCTAIGDKNCQALANYDSVGFSQVINYLQLTGAGIVYVIPVVVGASIVTSAIIWSGAFSALGLAVEVTGGVALATGGPALALIPDSLDLIRLYDFAKIYHDDFLMDDTGIITLENDSIKEIISELL